MAIGVYYMTLMHDKREIQTAENHKKNGVVKEEHNTDNLDTENLHTFNSFTNGISKFSSDFYQVIIFFYQKEMKNEKMSHRKIIKKKNCIFARHVQFNPFIWNQ